MNIYRCMADAVLILHGLVVLFILLGQLMVMLGGWRNWAWVRNLCFRSLHLLAILIVTLQAWLNLLCPLTTIEMKLRELAGQEGYEVSFVQYWLNELLYYSAPWWVFVIIYSLFALVVVGSWVWVRPGHPRSSQ